MIASKHQRNDIARAVDALYAIPSDLPRDQWVMAGMSFQAAGGSFEDFDNWSAQASNYKANDSRDVWRSIKPGKGVGEGTLYHMARGFGFDKSTQPPANSPPTKQTTPKPLPKPAAPVNDPLLIWSRFETATNEHPYIQAKGAAAVPLEGLRVVPDGDSLRIMGESMAGALVVPVQRPGGELASLQFITVGETAERLKVKGKPNKMNLPGASVDGWFTVGEMLPGGVVYLCEGIGTAWAAWRATGSAAVVCFGAGNMGKVAQALRQQDSAARLMLCPDVGKEAQAQSIAAAVGGAVALMPDGWANNSDIHDLAETEGLDMVAALLNSASEPPKPEPRYKLLTAADIEAMPPIDWLIKGVLPARGLAQIYGASKAGKSFLAFDMACAIAEGRGWFGYRVNAAPVVYVCLEGEAGFKLRVEAWKRHNDRPLPSSLHLVMQPFRINLPEDVQDLSAVVPDGAVVIVDTQNRAASDADENASKDMGLIINGAKNLQGLVDGLIVLVAHTGVSEGAQNRPRGHSSQIAAVDAAIAVMRNGDARTWRADKVKDGQDGAEHGFELVKFDLGTDDDGDPLTSCAIAVAEITKRLKPMTESQRKGVAAYCLACEAGGGLLDQAGEFGGLPLEAWRAKFYEMSTADNPDAKKKAFQRARNDLKKDGIAAVLNDIYTLNDHSTNIRTSEFKAAAISKAATGTTGTTGH